MDFCVKRENVCAIHAQKSKHVRIFRISLCQISTLSGSLCPEKLPLPDSFEFIKQITIKIKKALSQKYF